MRNIKEFNLLGIIITYFPNIEETQENIWRIIDDVDFLIIWENTPLSERTNYKLTLNEYNHKIAFMSEYQNMFIAYPLNQAIKFANANGYNYLITLDQDSCFEKEKFNEYIQWIKSRNVTGNRFVFGANPNYIYKNNEIELVTNSLITSGTVYKLNMFEKTGLFREDFQIDGVDFDMSFKAIKCNYKNIVNTKIIFQHSFGTVEKSKFGFSFDNYSSFRLYRILRNHVRLWIEYPQEFKPIRNSFISFFIIKRIPKIIISEKDKIRKILAIIFGILDGIFNSFSHREKF